MDTKRIRAIQRAYPQVWFACHEEHRGRRSGDGLTDREAGVLAHLAALAPARPSELARHLGIGRPATTALLQRLARGGWIVQSATGGDRRTRTVRLTANGRRAVSERSPLVPERVNALLDCLRPAERDAAVRGLELLARAARRVRRRLEGTRG
jgi:DNA-binding MarR family transcriptional regulator